ncbi:proliferation marker protein Ki-67 [Centropristis striata]|uniref:proliferation marker protein Ki-67 n=1 Tax=Centropristis striata TaxID=184440 RepID=UPI0027DEF38A|nr:proliferation marker protein Ki-67 [Centropristis striata]
MPLHGKIVVIKRSGGDGTEFPLTATCLFGRKPDCDIRIQLPQVSKEHCRIDLNENKEIILTNLSSVNPTRVNGEALQQSERLKHGDVITIIDRSFRFESPPAPTPKKRSSIGGKTETFKVLQDQQVGDAVTAESEEKRISEVSTDPHLKDGANHDNIQRSLEKTMELDSKEETTSPFNDLYQMIKKSLDVKTPRKSSVSVLQTPTSRFCTPKPASVRKNEAKPVISTVEKSTPKKDEAKVSAVTKVEDVSAGTPKSVKKQRRSSQVLSADTPRPEAENAEATSPQKRIRTPPQRFTPEVKSPVRRRSKEATPTVKEMSKKRKSGELAADLPTSQMKKKRVSFGGFLCPELFDKRLPPDSPLRKGAAPRRSLCVSKPKQSLLRRASVIGLLQEFDNEHPDSPAKRKTPSPKKTSSAKSSPKTPTPGKKSPKSTSTTPKAASPGKKSPKSGSTSPKAASPGKKSPKSSSPSTKAVSSAKKSPKSKSPSPARGKSPAVGGKAGAQTPTVQGRFSVSLISTPSPVSEDVVADQVPVVTATPRRKSISRETAKSAAKVIRRSGISRASLKVKSSWADRVRFGQPKPQVIAPAKTAVIQKPKKKAVPKPQTPARKIHGHFSTGHADSPVTIVVGRAHRQKVVHPTGAAPRLVTNTAVLKKDMKMDEDLTGIVDMFKTPARKRRSVMDDSDATKTPVGALGTSVVEPSVLSTPEEPGEMMVSPLNVTSTVKDRKYNSEAVQRLLNDDQESSLISDAPALEIDSEDSNEQQCTDLKTASVTTPKQKPELPECLTGVKRIMKTPRQKTEPIEDLRGKILKTPKQKAVQQECLTGVKRIMKTPRQKAEPIEDLRGKILKTPKQKAVQQECLTGVKKMMETPRREAEHVEDIKVELLTTPKQKLEQLEAEPVEDLQEKVPETPKALEAGDADSDLVEELVEAPAQTQESEDLSEMPSVDTPNTKSSPAASKRMKKTPREKSAPVEDMVGVKRLMKTPRVKGEAVEENFGIKRLVTRRSKASVEDFRGLQELMEEPLTEPTGQMETNEVEDQTSLERDEVAAKELDFAPEEPQDDVPSDVVDVLEVDVEKDEVVVDDHLEEVPSGSDDNESSDAMETVSQAAVEENVSAEQPTVDAADEKLSQDQPEVDTADENIPEEEPKVDTVEDQPEHVDTVEENITEEQPAVDAEVEKLSSDEPEVDTADENIPEEEPKVDTVEDQPEQVDTVDEIVSVEQPEVETATAEVTEMETTATNPAQEKKSVRGRRAKTVESKAADDEQQAAEHSEDAVVSAPVRGTRGKKTEAAAPPAVRQTTRGRNAKSQESVVDEPAVEKSEPLPAKVAPKPKRGRNAKKASEDQAEVVQEVATETEVVAEPESEPTPPVDPKADDGAAPPEKAVIKPRRGRKTKKPEESVPEQQDVPSIQSDEVPQPEVTKDEDANNVCSDQLEVAPTENDENKPSETMETVAQVPVTESLPEVTEMDAPVIQKKTVRGRRAKVVESESADGQHEAAEEPVVSLPVRGRRGKKTEVAAPAAVRQTTRGRNAKSQENPTDDAEVQQEKAVETPAAEISTEAVIDQTPSVTENKSAPPAEEAVVKPVRGRKTKQTPIEPPQPEPEKNEVIDEPVTDAQPQKSVPALVKPRRGRKTKADAVEENEVVEDTVVAMETKEQAQPPVRAKRGRNAKQEEEKMETTSVETTKSQEPAKKVRRTRKAEQEEPEVQAVETVPEEAEAPLVAEPVKIDEQAAVAAKPRRGGRKAKLDTESEAPVVSTEVQEIPAVTCNKLKRGKRGKQVAEEVEAPAAVPEEKHDNQLEAEEKKDAETEVPVVKPSKARGAKTSVKNEVSQAVPAKRVRRGAAPPVEENSAESTVVVSEPASVEPVKRGRRAAAKPTAEEATVTSVQANPSEDASNAVVEETKTSKRAVKWKADLEVIEIPKATPVRAVKGRKSKLQADTESNTASKEADKSEEKDLSDEVAEAQPVKRARRGAKVADVTADEAESASKGKGVEAEMQPKTRRGRSAKK